jgi:hypothetical protein
VINEQASNQRPPHNEREVWGGIRSFPLAVVKISV